MSGRTRGHDKRCKRCFKLSLLRASAITFTPALCARALPAPQLHALMLARNGLRSAEALTAALHRLRLHPREHFGLERSCQRLAFTAAGGKRSPKPADMVSDEVSAIPQDVDPTQFTKRNVAMHVGYIGTSYRGARIFLRLAPCPEVSISTVHFCGHETA